MSIALLLAFLPQTLPQPPIPAENPQTPDKILLGKALFWDEQLSSTNTIACGTCHIPAAGGIDPRVELDTFHVNVGPDGVYGTPDDRMGSRGVALSDASGLALFHADHGIDEQVTPRRTFSMINSAFFNAINWEGAAGPDFVDPETGITVSTTGAGLEAQALGPIISDVEMGHVGRTWAEVDAKLTAATPLRLAENLPAPLAAFIAGQTYPDLFALAFAGEPTPQVINARRIAQAIASYQRTLISNETPFDDWAAGNTAALTAAENAGRVLFSGAANCLFCHPAPMFSDFSFQNTGVRPIVEDPGRQLVTGFAHDAGRFRTTGLRNVSLRPRLFHNGQFANLTEVIEFYDRGGDFFVNQSTIIGPLNLSATQKSNLLAFLTTALTDPRVANELPPFDRPTLFTESTRVPVFVGAPTPGTGGVAPRAVCSEPPLLGSPQFTLGVVHGTAGLPLLFAYDMQGSPTPGGSPLFGALVHVNFGPSTRLVNAGVLISDGAGGGWAGMSVPLPSNPALAGLHFFSQWFVLDPGAAQGLAATAATKITLF